MRGRSVDGEGRNGRVTASHTAASWLLAAALLLMLASVAQAGEPPALPNILWIVGENLALDLGCYGGPNVETPRLDRLAEQGMRYTNVYATSPVCAPSRSAFMTGMYQTTTDMHHMRSHRDDDFRLPAGVRPLTHRLRDAGYYTANLTRIGDQIIGTGKLDLNFVNEGELYDTDDWEELKSHQPFFAQINTPEIEYDIYDRKTVEKKRVKWVGEEDHPQIATAGNVTPPPYYPDHPLVRQEWARYLNSISGMDRRIGRVLDRLAADGLAENTVVMFFGDNGRLEARGIHWCWDMGLHVPLIVYWPQAAAPPRDFQPGKVSDRVVSLLDITATTLAIARIERPIAMQSRVFLGPTADPPRRFAFSARDRIDETQNRIRSVRGARYHYLRNFTPEVSFTSLNRYKEKCFPVKPLMRELAAAGKLHGAPLQLMQPRLPPEELYDTKTDPHEIHNLVDSAEPEHRAALLQLRAALQTWMIESGDRGHLREPASVVAPFEKEMHDWFGTPAWYRGGP
ncbi:sulfatase family protein [Lignipirellula cremea]|nr:sulfatase [Lignipirellula cremea]